MLSEVFYSECACCKSKISYKKYLCLRCLLTLHNLFIKNYCSSCGFPAGLKTTYCRYCSDKKNFQYTYFNFNYKGAVKTIITDIKFKNSIKAIHLLKHMARKILKVDFVRRYDIISPIPTHWLRRLKRFIHPADIVAKELSKRENIPFKKILKRRRLTKYQWTLDHRERFKNVRGSFMLCNKVEGLNILLIDDIYTSGATLNEASLLLKKAGASVVDCYILAKSGV